MVIRAACQAIALTVTRTIQVVEENAVSFAVLGGIVVGGVAFDKIVNSQRARDMQQSRLQTLCDGGYNESERQSMRPDMERRVDACDKLDARPGGYAETQRIASDADGSFKRQADRFKADQMRLAQDNHVRQQWRIATLADLTLPRAYYSWQARANLPDQPLPPVDSKLLTRAQAIEPVKTNPNPSAVNRMSAVTVTKITKAAGKLTAGKPARRGYSRAKAKAPASRPVP
jgi:hypothetical protein